MKALGYLSDPLRDPVVDEKIQMHADKLYQQQLAQDEAAKKGRKDYKPLPPALSTFSEGKEPSKSPKP